jgi:hypothetical protein
MGRISSDVQIGGRPVFAVRHPLGGMARAGDFWVFRWTVRHARGADRGGGNTEGEGRDTNSNGHADALILPHPAANPAG